MQFSYNKLLKLTQGAVLQKSALTLKVNFPEQATFSLELHKMEKTKHFLPKTTML